MITKLDENGGIHMKKSTDNESVGAVNKRIKQEKGSITLYVLISMMFFLMVILGIYVNSSNKIQKQEKEIEKIQKEYEKEDINDLYEEVEEEWLED